MVEGACIGYTGIAGCVASASAVDIDVTLHLQCLQKPQKHKN